MSLHVLPPVDSVRLLAALIGQERVDAEPAEARRIAELCGHLPLTLRIVGERTAARPMASLSEVIEELTGEQRRLDALAIDDDDLADTRAIFSWSYQALTPELQATFRLLGLHASAEISTEAAAALAGAEIPAIRKRLRALTDVHLLQEHEANRFRMHDLLRSYALERTQAEDSQSARTQATQRMLGWYLLMADRARRAVLPNFPEVPLVPADGLHLRDGFTDGPEALRWFDAERLNLLAALHQAHEVGQYELCWKLAFVTTGLFELRSHWSEMDGNHKTGLEAARALGDRLGEAANLLLLADSAWRAGNLDDAPEHYLEAARIGREISVGWLAGFATRGLGLLREEQGDHREAVGHFESALAVFREIGDRRGEAMSLLSLGKCARALGDLSRAETEGRAAVAILQEINDLWSVAWGRLPLADALGDRGADDEAIALLRQAAAAFQEFGDQRCEAMALVPLGHLLRRSGDTAAAREGWSRAVRLYEELGDSGAQEVQALLNTPAGPVTP
ncbi:hypothetical protein GCM10023085_74370 [Actinomadura viridis]|uniref:Tetratricopeptide (TPR) repeat protein n=1 Tax=Actinomadura viridis TaxID=58110 RepID=A0A931GI29_9ACTN|nr:tetratricopeptide repeat protein [Actinomadura viridis]MBG6087557.1 tetratricopeptide (TPR) repeat protein [Actinomadura viridis]